MDSHATLHTSPLIAPSLLSADFACLGAQVSKVEAAGADLLHLDVMDGHFVPNLTFGPPLIRALRPHSGLLFDAHLMITQPERYLQAFREAGADIITVHQEACVHLHRTLSEIRRLGAQAGVALNPATSAALIEPILELCDVVLVMSVNPGFSGQSFIESALGKVERLAHLRQAQGYNFKIEVDGGVNDQTAPRLVAAGADILVSGAYLFSAPDYAAAIQTLKRARA